MNTILSVQALIRTTFFFERFGKATMQLVPAQENKIYVITKRLNRIREL
jgi:hypothetical protein